MKTSRDNGATWSKLRILDWSGANPAAVYDAHSDRVVVHYLFPASNIHTPYPVLGGVHTKQILCFSDAVCGLPVSLDPWLVWRGPGYYPLGQKPMSPIGVAPGPGLGVQLRGHAALGATTGRLVFAGHAGQVLLVWYSDDHAHTWTLSNATFGSNDKSAGFGPAGCNKPEGCYDEPFVVELPDGTLELNARNDSSSCEPETCCAYGCGYLPTPCCALPGGCPISPTRHARIVAHSTDGGATFGPAHAASALQEPTQGCQGSSLVVERKNAGASSRGGRGGATVFFSGPQSNIAMRTNLSVLRSEDGGRTYPLGLARQIWAGAGGYSCLTHLAPGGVTSGSVGIAFERDVGGWSGGCWGGGCRISFVSVT